MSVKFEVIYSQWAGGDEVFGGGVHEVAKPSAEFLGLLGAAEAAGSVVVLEADDTHRAKLDKAVQSQEDGEKAWQKAFESGEWQKANYEQFDLDVMSGTRSEDL